MIALRAARCLPAALICLGAFVGTVVQARTATTAVADAHHELRARYANRLSELASWADSQQLAAEAAITRGWLPSFDIDRIYLASRPAIDAAGDEASRWAALSTEWRDKFWQLRREQGAALFALASDAVAKGQASAAFPLLVETIREDRDHADARKILGYELVDGAWLTPFAARKAREGQVWHEKYGWLHKDQVARYEAGERFYNGRWMPAEQEQKLRSDMRRGWDVATEHYMVRTNHSLEQGVRLASRLERLYDAWQQMFAGFVANDEQLARRFAGRAAARGVPRRHKVVYFRNRDEYNQALANDQPNIGISSGYYLADRREAYFFAQENEDDSTLSHEATHQLFHEIKPVARDIGQVANFWIVEGIACYMESLSEADGWHRLGGRDAVRLRDAEHRLLVDDYYVPLAELTTYGMERLQQDARIARLYSQMSGLVHFLVHYDEGRYRHPLVEYLVTVYAGRDRASTLSELTKSSDQELDRQYRQFIESLERRSE